MNWNPHQLPDLRGRTYAVTGATPGIGYFAAEQLAAGGAEVVLASRSTAKLQQADATIREHVPGAVTRQVRVDLESLASVAEAAEELASVPRLDGVFLNGGPLTFSSTARTADGLPLLFGTHTVANVALIARLLPSLARSNADRAPRIVHASTAFVRMFRPRVADVVRTPRMGMTAYIRAKAALEIFAFELERRLRAAELPPVSVMTHPGIGVDAKTPHRTGVRDETVPYQRHPYTPWAHGKDAAAWPGVRALVDPDVVGGEYYGPAKGGRGEPVRIRSTAATAAPPAGIAQDVWSRLVDMAGVDISV